MPPRGPVDRLKCSLPTCPPGSTTTSNSDRWVPHETTRGPCWAHTASSSGQKTGYRFLPLMSDVRPHRTTYWQAHSMNTTQAHRSFYAEFIVKLSGSGDERLIAAFSSVPREDYLGPGPWPVSVASGYIPTLSAEPYLLYQDILIGLETDRRINNGQPSLHAECLAVAAPGLGETVVHVGAGTPQPRIRRVDRHSSTILSMVRLPSHRKIHDAKAIQCNSHSNAHRSTRDGSNQN